MEALPWRDMANRERNLTPTEARVLSRFFSQVEPKAHADIYLVTKLPQEIRATLNGLYSRTHLSMRETFLRRLTRGLEHQGKTLDDLPLPTSSEDVLANVLVEKAGEFLRTYAIDHGHNSLREGAVLHLAVERVSQLVTRFMQRERRASFEESSTRYISFKKEGHWHDPAIRAAGDPWSSLYESALHESFTFYSDSIEQLQAFIRRKRPLADGEDEKAYERAVRAEAFDAARYLLTPAIHTKFGLVADARTIADMVTQLTSHPNEEFRIVGERLREEAERAVPTLLTYARANPFLDEARDTAATLLRELGLTEAADRPEAAETSVRLLGAPDDLDQRLLVGLLFEQAEVPVATLRARIADLSLEERGELFKRLLATRGKRDPMPEGFEAGGMLDFEVVLDFGAYRDIGRHRKGFQQQQRLTTRHGFAVPPLFDEAGLGDRYRAVMSSVGEKAAQLAERFPDGAGYVIPFGYLQRVRIQFDARQMAYFVELRSAPDGHFSYRDIAIRMGEALGTVAPLYAEWVRICASDVFLGRVATEQDADARRQRRQQRAGELGFET